MAIKIEMLRCFVSVAHHGNLMAASDAMGRTPSALSMTLKQLEEHLGSPLFEKDRKNKLSALGSYVLEHAINELQQFDRTVQTIEDFANGNAGSVRVATVPSITGTIMPHAIESFIADHPGVHVELRDMDSSRVLHELEQDRADIGIATALDVKVGIHRTPLLSDKLGLICHRDHPLAQNDTPLEWNALETFNFISNDLCGMIHDPVFQAINKRAKLTVYNTTSLLAMVQANVGVTILPRLAAKLDPKQLTVRPLADVDAVRRIELFRRATSTPSPAVLAFEQHVLNVSLPRTLTHK